MFVTRSLKGVVVMQLIGEQKKYGIKVYIKKELRRETKKPLYQRDIEYNIQTGLIDDSPYEDCTYLVEVHTLQPNVLAIEIDNRKKITRKSSILKTEKQSVEGSEKVISVFQKRVRVTMHSQLNIPITNYPENHFKIIENDDKGNVIIYEIAIISDNGLLYLTFQKVRGLKVLKDKSNIIICPELDVWDSMLQLIKDIYSSRIRSLTKYDQDLTNENQLKEFSLTNELIEKIKEADERLNINLAVGIWFNFANRFGMAATSQGMARVHCSQIERSDAFPKHIGVKEKFIYDKIISLEDSNTRFKREVKGLVGPIITKK